MESERLAAYAAGDLSPNEQGEVEAAIARDPELRARLERIRAADAALAELEAPEPTPEFSARLRSVALEAARDRDRDELAVRRLARRRSLMPLAGAAAAALVIAVLGGAVAWTLRGGSLDTGPVAMDPMSDSLESAGEVEPLYSGPQVEVVATTNDYSELELRRLTVNVDTQYILHHEWTVEEARPLADQLVAQLLGHAQGEATLSSKASSSEARTPRTAADADPIARCLPAILAEARVPLVPVLVELARFQGEDAVIFVFAAEEPTTGEYRRIEAWAVDRATCDPLGFAQYDRL